MIPLADDENMMRLQTLAEEFYARVLQPDEEPGFVSDEASLLDISLAPKELLIEKIEAVYGKRITRFDLGRPFWSLLTRLNEG